MNKHTRRIAPRLADGSSRDRLYNALPPEVKLGLKAIAARKRESVSWVIEQIIIKEFNLRQPKYVRPTQPATILQMRRTR